MALPASVSTPPTAPAPAPRQQGGGLDDILSDVLGGNHKSAAADDLLSSLTRSLGKG